MKNTRRRATEPRITAADFPLAEADYLARVIDTAQLHGWHVAHFRPARTANGWRTPMTGDVGFPDLVLARRGRVILAELKTDTGTFRPGQPEWLEELGDHGRLWRPKHWPQVHAELTERTPA